MNTMTELRHGNDDDKDLYEYRECGLEGIFLRSGYEIVHTEHGDGLTIKNIDGLHAAIGEFLVCHKKMLAGKEIRFLRKEMDLTQEELGSLVGVEGQTVARWEKGTTDLAGPADGLLRLLYIGTVHGKLDPMKMLAELKVADEPEADSIFLEETAGAWHLEAA